jgi:hypothetical protein
VTVEISPEFALNKVLAKDSAEDLVTDFAKDLD